MSYVNILGMQGYKPQDGGQWTVVVVFGVTVSIARLLPKKAAAAPPRSTWT